MQIDAEDIEERVDPGTARLRALWAEVLYRALEDARGNASAIYGNGMAKHGARKQAALALTDQARRWFASDDNRACS